MAAILQGGGQMELVNQPDAVPTRKVQAAGIGGALGIIVCWMLNAYVLPQPLPAEVAAAITAVISAGLGYMAKERAQ